jgi:hypothetical protein
MDAVLTKAQQQQQQDQQDRDLAKVKAETMQKTVKFREALNN